MIFFQDESLLKIREEEEKRKEVSAKFQATLNEITTLMQQNNDKNLKLRDDNIDMNAKLKNVCEQYELREQQVEKISKQMQLEAQLADAKLAKAKMEMAAEREIMLREKQQILMVSYILLYVLKFLFNYYVHFLANFTSHLDILVQHNMTQK